MASGSIMCESREIKGVGLDRLVRLSPYRVETKLANAQTAAATEYTMSSLPVDRPLKIVEISAAAHGIKKAPST
jgi:hypothetical protein